MVKKSGLGRGLDALLSATNQATPVTKTNGITVTELPVDLLCRGQHQARQEFDPDALKELADSIRAQGVLQPILVRKLAKTAERHEQYEILAGERRWRASQLAELATIPAIIKEVDDQHAAIIGLIENLQRDDLNPLEEVQGIARLIEEFALTHQQAADVLGKSRAMISNLLRLLELTDEVKEMLGSGALDMGHARALLALQGAEQVDVGYRVVSQGLSVRETERLVKQRRADQPPVKTTQRGTKDPNVLGLESRLSSYLGAPVTIRTGKKGRGQVVISYHSLDELDGIIGRFGQE